MQSASAPATSIDPKQFRRALGRFATGVTIVTSAPQDGPAMGLTVSSFTSLSLDPPLILWSVARSSRRAAPILEADGFVVNVLSDDQRHLAESFSRGKDDPFADVEHTLSEAGIPILTGAVAHFECDHFQQYEGGDHIIVVGRVTRYAEHEGTGLIYASGTFCTPGSTVHPRPTERLEANPA